MKCSLSGARNIADCVSVSPSAEGGEEKMRCMWSPGESGVGVAPTHVGMSDGIGIGVGGLVGVVKGVAAAPLGGVLGVVRGAT
jgi:hypothetical protein